VTDDLRPSLSIRLGNSEQVDHVRILVTESGRGPVWDSGLLPFDSPFFIYGGAALTPKTVYEVVAEGHLREQIVARCSGGFETGFLGSRWDARWIEPVQEPAIRETEVDFHELFTPHEDDFGGQARLRPCRELKRVFVCGGSPAHARLYVTAHGVYDLCVNGQRPGTNLLAPETSAYPSRLYYQTYDVAGLLRPGENEILITLADGWWIGRIGLSGDSCQYGDRLGLLMQLDWRDGSGEAHTLCSDTSFESRRSHIDYADLFIGERHDYVAPAGEWLGVTTATYEMDNLIAQPISPVSNGRPWSPSGCSKRPTGSSLPTSGSVLPESLK